MGATLYPAELIEPTEKCKVVMAQEKEKYDVKSGIIQGSILGKLAEVFSGSFSTTKVVHA